MDWLFGDEENSSQSNRPDYSTLQGILSLPVAEAFEKWPEEEKDPKECPERIGIKDNRFRLLGG